MQATLLLVQEAGIKPIYHLHYNYILFPGYKLDGPLKEYFHPSKKIFKI